MFGKLLGALALALIPLAPATPEALTDNPSIMQVVCKLEGGTGRGTAFRISPELVVSVAHVTSLGNCTIKGQPVHTLIEDAQLDFSLIYLPGDEPTMPIRCDGFHKDEMVFAIGHARGLPEKRILVLAGTGYRVQLREGSVPIGLLAYNRIIPGMSGGPIVDAKGRVVGLNNAYSPVYNISFSRELRDTVLCK